MKTKVLFILFAIFLVFGAIALTNDDEESVNTRSTDEQNSLDKFNQQKTVYKTSINGRNTTVIDLRNIF